MLEQTALLIEPWDGALPRRILDAATRASLGLVRTGRPTGFWARWLQLPSLEVCETDDLALLCRIRGHWGQPWRWSVQDADEHFVGCLDREAVTDRSGQTVAVRQPIAGGTSERFLSPAGVELGVREQGAEGVRLSYAVWLEGEPFARMLLLAAALTSEG
jgi:hypothetical protein